MTSGQVAAEVQVLREGAGAVPLDRDVVLASGDAVVDYLQGQLSQDVAGLSIGSSAHTFVLQPQGKVDVWFRITRTGEQAYVLDCDAGWGDALVARLERFRLRTKVAFDPVAWEGWAFRGSQVGNLPGPRDPSQGILVEVDRPGELGCDALGPALTAPSSRFQLCSLEALEVLRIEAGIPRMGAEVDASTIPAETGMVGESVSFTKGCYTGQELVARVDSRGGRAPRRIVRLDADGDVPPAIGAPLLDDGTEVGRVTSAVADGAGRVVALGLLARAVDTPRELVVDGLGTVRAREVPGLST